jgi:hypothetical protein
MIFNFFKSYSEKDIIEAVSFLDEIDSISKNYISEMDLEYLLRDIKLTNPHQVRNIKLVGIYYHALTKIFKGKSGDFNSWLQEAYKYKYKEYDKSVAKIAFNGFSSIIKSKVQPFLDGYTEAKNFKGDIKKLIVKYYKEFAEAADKI